MRDGRRGRERKVEQDESGWSALAEVGDEVDGYGDRHRPEQVGKECVRQSFPPGVAAVRSISETANDIPMVNAR